MLGTRRAAMLTLFMLLLGTILVPRVATAALPAALPPALRWQRTVAGRATVWSSPVIANLDGTGNNNVVVGGQNGFVYAYDAGGNLLPGWPAKAQAAVDSSPAVGDLDGNGRNEVVVGAGSLEVAGQRGGVTVIDANGQVRCNFLPPPSPDGLTQVFNAPAIGDVTGSGINDIVFGSFNHHIYVIDGHCNKVADFDNGDTVWSAPALYDTDHRGAKDIFIGGDSSPGGGGTFHAGGIYRSLRYQGGTLVERWERNDSQEDFQNGSAIGDLEGNGRLAVVTGSGAYWCRQQGQCADSSKVWAFHLDDGSNVPGWPKAATYNTFLAAPALGDLDGDGRVDVVIGSVNYVNGNPAGGAIDEFLSGSGYARSTWTSPYENLSSPLIVDAGGGAPEIVSDGVVLDRKMNQVATYAGFTKNAAAAGTLGAGRWVLASAGADTLSVYDIPTPTSAPWPQFEQNAQRTGTSLVAAPLPPCGQGYRMVAADGGMFTFGNAPFLGSAGSIHLNFPVVGMSITPGGGGYWLVARDGGIFNYGSASFLGSTGSIQLNQPIVGMAASHTGNGYWLGATDGGIFNYGDAAFDGSTGSIHLNSPMVGMAAAPSSTATPGGNGYWMVARDGGVFNFGVAGFHGSTGSMHLNQPIVGMAATPSGGGYWLVASDGGIFNFGDAGFFGSTGSLHLNSPIVGMAPTGSGHGYWLVAADGGIFSFGDAPFCGSVGGTRLNSPVVGMG